MGIKKTVKNILEIELTVRELFNMHANQKPLILRDEDGAVYTIEIDRAGEALLDVYVRGRVRETGERVHANCKNSRGKCTSWEVKILTPRN